MRRWRVCDVIIATPEANLGMAGPAMIEGGGLGHYRPEDIGPVDVQTTNGVIDLSLTTRRMRWHSPSTTPRLFSGSHADWEAHDQAAMRDIVPENRKRIYEVRDASRHWLTSTRHSNCDRVSARRS